ncbi:hypothetical protein C6500_15745 [Candidatus Poribacteria bacterium]|nr:MAG: hypothetical protein C6500_15745 [Candidatus Poribacteria bacterium]
MKLKDTAGKHILTDTIIEPRCFLEISTDMFGYISCDGSFVALNSVWEEVLGFTQLELQNSEWSTFIHPEEREEVLSEIEKVKTGKRDSVAFENRFQHKDASYRWLRWRAIKDAEKQLCYVVATDVTPQKQLEARLKESETRFQQLVAKHVQEAELLHTLMENTPDHIYFKDTESRFMRINRSLADWFGLKNPAEAVHKTDFDFFTREHAQQAYQDEQDVIESGKPIEAKQERETWPHEQDTWVSTTKVPIRDREGRIVGTCGISRDITEYYRAQQAVEYASRAKSDFLANMSHELRTPLNAIIGFAEILRDELVGSINDEQRECINDIHISGEHLLEMINDILDLSKIEAGKMALQLETFSIVEAVEEVNAIITALAVKKDLDLTLNYTQNGMIEADRVKFKQIFYNLLSNAVKFTPEGGKVSTKLEIGTTELQAEVVDTGIGISEADQAKLFAPFTQIDTSKSRRYGGTGLGLALTHRLIVLHGGEISVTSREGEGSNFALKIPLQQLKRESNVGLVK